MGYRHSRDDILAGALALAADEGLSQLTFGRVARHLGISDRIVVYYFPTKDDLVGAVLVSLAVELQLELASAFRSLAADHVELVRAAWPVVARPEADRTFALFLEANGLAAVGREPFASLVPQLVEAWIDWAADRLTGAAARRRSEAEAAIALLDGLLLLRQMAGQAAANRAATRLGVRGRRR